MNLSYPPLAENAGLREIKSYLALLHAELRTILENLDETNLSAEAYEKLERTLSKADAASKALSRFTPQGDFIGKAAGINGILPIENGGTGASDVQSVLESLGIGVNGFHSVSLASGVTVPEGSVIGWRNTGTCVFLEAHPIFSFTSGSRTIASGFPEPKRNVCFSFQLSGGNLGCAELTQDGILNVLWVYSFSSGDYLTSGSPEWTSMTFGYFVDE